MRDLNAYWLEKDWQQFLGGVVGGTFWPPQQPDTPCIHPTLTSPTEKQLPHLLWRHALGLAQRGAQQRLEVEVEAHGRLAVQVGGATHPRHLHQQVLEARPGVKVPRRPAGDSR